MVDLGVLGVGKLCEEGPGGGLQGAWQEAQSPVETTPSPNICRLLE
jgi:hypothetical protein